MPERREALYDASAAMWLKEEESKFYKASAFDGLLGAQIVREWRQSGNGIAIGQIDHLLMKMDFSADANSGVVASQDCGSQGALRYVADPIVGQKQFLGLYVGGPVELVLVGENEQRVFRQTLTRVRHSAGWVYNPATKCVEFTSAGGGEDSGESSESGADTGSSGAVDMLKKTRPEVKRARALEAPYREDKYPVLRMELMFRYFTHESRSDVEAMTKEDMQLVVAHHCADSDAWRPLKTDFTIDRETNGGVVTLSCLFVAERTVGEIADLKDMPYDLKPATRDTLNEYGLLRNADGEAYIFGKVMVWDNLSRDSEAALTLPVNIDFLEDVVDKTTYKAWSNTETGLIKEGGRVWYIAEGFSGTRGNTFALDVAAGAVDAWWRVKQFKLEENELGLLRFIAYIVRPERIDDYYTYTYTVKSRGSSGTATVHVYSNQTFIQKPTLAAGFTEDASWRMQDGLYSGTVTHRPTFYTESTTAPDEDWTETRRWPDTTFKKPGGSTLSDEPADGYYWRVFTEVASCIITTGSSYANTYIASGGPGSHVRRLKKGLYLAKKVTSLTPTAWSDAEMSY